MRSNLTGRVVDSYTNILTVKLFARAQDEDAWVREAIDDHTSAFRDQTRMITGYIMILALMNATLIVSTAGVAIWQWTAGRIALGAVATAMPLAWQLTNIAGWVARSVTAIFENIGTVQDGMRSIAVPRQMPDAAGRRAAARHRWRNPLRRTCISTTAGCACRTATGPPGGAARHRPDHRARRARRPGRAVRRGQIHAGEPAAAFLRSGAAAAS